MTIRVKIPGTAPTEPPATDSPDGRLEWRAPPARPVLPAGELHLWRILTDDRGAVPGDCLGHLSEGQRLRAERMQRAELRNRYLRAQAGLRAVLSRYLDCAPAHIELSRGPAGKPYLGHPARPLQFNLTTTADLALVAVLRGHAPTEEIGIDCELIRPRGNLLGIARRMLEPQAIAELESSPEPDRLPLFHRYWTALEADAKADGRGLFRPRAPQAKRPAIRHFVPERGYIAAVAGLRLPARADWTAFDLEASWTTPEPRSGS